MVQRRNFIKSGLLGGLALSVLPSEILWANTEHNWTIFDMPTATKHIRHGIWDYQPSMLAKKRCDWVNQVQKDIFLQYGVGQESDGLLHFSMNLEQKLLNIGINDNTIFVTTETDTLEGSLMQETTVFQVYDNYVVKIINLDAEKEFVENGLNQELFMTPLVGEIMCNQQLLQETKGCYTQGLQKVRLKSKQQSIVLLLSKNIRLK